MLPVRVQSVSFLNHILDKLVYIIWGYSTSLNTHRAGVLLRAHQPPDIDRGETIPLMSDEIPSPSPLPELPPEIWLEVFRLATFIPLETDLSATTVEPGLFGSKDNLQLLAFEKVLPLRRAIVEVSRRFYQIGTEVLYTAYHTTFKNLRRLLLFSDLLVSRPELGRFVKRLSLRWTDDDEEMNYRIINRCPNVLMFSSFQLPHDDNTRWWRRGLPKTIRSFDAQVHNISVNVILSLLEVLPHLELLHLSPLFKYAAAHAPVCLSALRILSVHRSTIDTATALSPPVLSAMQLPSLTTLATNVVDVHARLSLPLDTLRRLEYFQATQAWDVQIHPSSYFHNLRYLEIHTSRTDPRPCLTYFPLHQLECLTVVYNVFPREWKQSFETLVVMPLDANAMPKLKRFQLIWGYGTCSVYHHIISSAGDGEDFLQCLETLVRRFEERNVLFVETNKREICPRFQPVCNGLAACKQS